ncbi:hypothetical protein [Evansella cellulosilytica]|uniref:Uncharacterized protein n=1 Tax=Evansella cellulosilytica (strain ATCC 21833 / DSM 2522 / FERM P-1141 / JCM 9156 / N-4) TaxID=649639 RepID=E6U0U1_EVAC2|nr:hypothetical protein [Evansella cellulosilytica]ADU29139.1 hypothetical protein Bcell_0862 [Evansella cellulosilytica DSM 2522]
MEASMSMEEVVAEIRRLQREMGALNKKKIKKLHPDLMKNALYYFPDWQHAVDKSIS